MKSALNTRPAPVQFIGYLRRHIVLVLIAMSFFALIMFPLADCFDCEGPQPWDRNDAAYATRSMLFDYWLAGASLLAGFSRPRFAWTVPVAITLIGCATEPLGGVAMWSLVRNEGPVMLIFGGSVGLASFFTGLIDNQSHSGSVAKASSASLNKVRGLIVLVSPATVTLRAKSCQVPHCRLHDQNRQNRPS